LKKKKKRFTCYETLVFQKPRNKIPQYSVEKYSDYENNIYWSVFLSKQSVSYKCLSPERIENPASCSSVLFDRDQMFDQTSLFFILKICFFAQHFRECDFWPKNPSFNIKVLTTLSSFHFRRFLWVPKTKTSWQYRFELLMTFWLMWRQYHADLWKVTSNKFLGTAEHWNSFTVSEDDTR